MGFSGNGSMLTAPMVQEGGVAAVVQDYSGGMRIPSEVSSSSHPPKEAGSSILASVEAEEDGTGRGRRQQQHGDEEDDDDSELELGLSLGAKKATGNSGASRNAAGGGAPWGEYCRILTAKDFPSIMVASRGSPISSSSSTASSSPSLDGSGGGGVGRAGVGVAGTKRAADFVSPEVGSRAAPSPVVGWPPIRAFRMNSLMNQSRDSSEEDSNKNNGDNGGHDKATGRNASILRSGVRENGVGKEHEKKGPLGGSPFVKANMDGMPIGRKVDLSAHHTYEALAMALEDMFQDPSSPSYPIRASNLLDGSSEFVLTYKDKDGDWMLVGDVPWGMFLGTVKRLRIMRASNATGLGPECRSSRVGGFRRCHV